MFYRGCCSIVHVCPSGSCFDLLMCSFPFDNGGVYSLANYSVAYEETQSNRVSDFHDVVRSLFPKAFLFDFCFCYVPRISLNLYALGLVLCIETKNKRLAGNCRCPNLLNGLRQAKSAYEHAQNVRIHIILRMHKILFGRLHCIVTFYSSQWFLQWTAKALIRCAVWSWPSMPAQAPNAHLRLARLNFWTVLRSIIKFKRWFICRHLRVFHMIQLKSVFRDMFNLQNAFKQFWHKMWSLPKRK